MKSLIVGLGLAVASTVAMAQAIKPWDVINFFRAVTYYQDPGTQEVTIEVRANANSLAHIGALREACERTFGTLVISNAEVINERLTKNRTATSSSCYIKTYTIIRETDTMVEMKVTTASTNVDLRVAGSSEDTKNVNGQEIATRLRTIGNSRSQNRNVLEAFFDTYPTGAWDLEAQRLEDGVDSRGPYVSLVYRYKLAHGFTQALIGILEHMNIKQPWVSVTDPRCYSPGSSYDVHCVRFYADKDSGGRRITITGYNKTYLIANHAYETLHEGFKNTGYTGVKLEVRDGSGNVLITRCRQLDMINLVMLNSSHGKIVGRQWTTESIEIRLNDEQLKRLSRTNSVDATISNQCVAQG